MATPDQSSFGGNPSTSEQLIAKLARRVATAENPDN